jgi:hypothetical protein
VFALFLDPSRLGSPGHCGYRRSPSGHSNGGRSARSLISGLDSRAFTRVVYASQGGSLPRHARLTSGCGPGSTRWDWLPTGFRRKVSALLLLQRFPLSQAFPDARTRQHSGPLTRAEPLISDRRHSCGRSAGAHCSVGLTLTIIKPVESGLDTSRTV